MGDAVLAIGPFGVFVFAGEAAAAAIASRPLQFSREQGRACAQEIATRDAPTLTADSKAGRCDRSAAKIVADRLVRS